MDLSAQAEVDAALRSSSIYELRDQHASIERELAALNEQIGDLAFNNYRTYADAGRTTQHCTQIFTEMNSKLKEVSDQVPALTEDIKQFFDKARKLGDESELVKAAIDRAHPMWDLIGLPAKMDMYIRTGYYDSAYALTNYGMTLQQHDIVKNPLVKLISDRMVEARALLLEELFNKFAGPLDLAASIQVVNNVRKIPFLSGTQLRVSVLQYRDLYLEKQILDITSHPEFALKAIDVYKECMYETVVLYTAVFPENELAKKDPTIDPRWESWPACTPSTILGEWASRNMRRLLDIVERAEMKSAFDISSVWSSLMVFASSFGRMGLDFRPIILHRLRGLVLERFKLSVREATARFHSVRTLNVLVAGFPQGQGNVADPSIGLADASPTQAPASSSDLSAWDDVCVYGNSLLDALNTLKYSVSPVLLSTVLSSLRESLESSLSWLALTFGGASGSQPSPHFERAARLLGMDLVSFLNRCLLYYFPYETISRLYGSGITKQHYLAYVDLNIREMMVAADGAEKLEEVLSPLLNRPKLSSMDIDAVLARPHGDTVAAEQPEPIIDLETGLEHVSLSHEATDHGDELPPTVSHTVATELQEEEAPAAVVVEAVHSPPPVFTIEDEQERNWGEWGHEEAVEQPLHTVQEQKDTVGEQRDTVVEAAEPPVQEWGWGEGGVSGSGESKPARSPGKKGKAD